jgi:hypothetical protein
MLFTSCIFSAIQDLRSVLRNKDRKFLTFHYLINSHVKYPSQQSLNVLAVGELDPVDVSIQQQWWEILTTRGKPMPLTNDVGD